VDIAIGEVARLTGLSVKTIRYYSQIGLVPEAGRTAAGYRRYDSAAVARLELVRALRELGIDLATVQRVLERPTSLEEMAATHASAIDSHIRQLTLRRAVLREIARGVSRPEEVQRMTAFAHASADEAGRIMEDFLSVVFEDHEENPFAARMRSALPKLPDAPSEAQVDAWIELAGLVGDPSFRERIRQMVTEGERQRASSGISDADEATQRAGQAVVERAGAALERGVAPGTPEATAVVDELVGLFASAAGRSDGPDYRVELATQLETFSDRRVERYWHLIGVVNGWPSRPSLMPMYEWFIAALSQPTPET
jgi:DNA-binding transcriptional MerR regulator